jgi:hypothetical protein
MKYQAAQLQHVERVIQLLKLNFISSFGSVFAQTSGSELYPTCFSVYACWRIFETRATTSELSRYKNRQLSIFVFLLIFDMGTLRVLTVKILKINSTFASRRTNNSKEK